MHQVHQAVEGRQQPYNKIQIHTGTLLCSVLVDLFGDLLVDLFGDLHELHKLHELQQQQQQQQQHQLVNIYILSTGFLCDYIS